jgi:HSP20 family molecular chaperone IbpA
MDMTTRMEPRSHEEVSREEHTRPGRTFVPKVDIVETDQGLRLWADLPGVDEKSLDVSFVDGVLTIDGRVAAEEYAELRPIYTEYNVGNFVRKFTLPTDIDPTAIKASLVDGVLELELPKAEHAKPRRIEIQTG